MNGTFKQTNVCFSNLELCLCVRANACDHGQVLYGSNYWQQGPSDTHSASHSGPNRIHLPPSFSPSPSVSPFPSVFFTTSLTLALSDSSSLSPSLSLWTKLLSYEPQQRGKVKPLSFFRSFCLFFLYKEQKSPAIF